MEEQGHKAEEENAGGRSRGHLAALAAAALISARCPPPPPLPAPFNPLGDIAARGSAPVLFCTALAREM